VSCALSSNIASVLNSLFTTPHTPIPSPDEQAACKAALSVITARLSVAKELKEMTSSGEAGSSGWPQDVAHSAHAHAKATAAKYVIFFTLILLYISTLLRRVHTNQRKDIKLLKKMSFLSHKMHLFYQITLGWWKNCTSAKHNEGRGLVQPRPPKKPFKIDDK
jgi:hypothetical protein